MTKTKNAKRKRDNFREIVLHSVSGKKSAVRKISAAALSKWKPLSLSSRNHGLYLVDYAIQMVLSRIKENGFEDVQSELITLRRNLAHKMENSVGPVSKIKSFKNLSTMLDKLKEKNEKLHEKMSILKKALKHEEGESFQLEEEIEALTSNPKDIQLHPVLKQSLEENTDKEITKQNQSLESSEECTE